MSTVLARWTNQCLMSAFESWHAHASEQKRMETVCRKIIARMLNVKLATAFVTWWDHAKHQRRMEDVCRNIIKRMSHGVQAAALASWRVYDKKCQVQEEAVMIMQHRKIRSDCHWTIQSWRANAEVSKNVRANRRRALMDSPLDRMLLEKRPHLIRSRSWQGPIAASNQTLRRLMEIRALQLGKY